MISLHKSPTLNYLSERQEKETANRSHSVGVGRYILKYVTS